jgi:hypothetical protein
MPSVITLASRRSALSGVTVPEGTFTNGTYFVQAVSCVTLVDTWLSGTKNGKRVQSNMGAKNHAILMPDGTLCHALSTQSTNLHAQLTKFMPLTLSLAPVLVVSSQAPCGRSALMDLYLKLLGNDAWLFLWCYW